METVSETQEEKTESTIGEKGAFNFGEMALKENRRTKMGGRGRSTKIFTNI